MPGAVHIEPGTVEIARAAGVHIWIETADALYTDKQYPGLHASADGEKRIHLAPDTRAFDAISGGAIAMEGNTAILSMKRAQTALLRLEEKDREPPALRK